MFIACSNLPAFHVILVFPNSIFYARGLLGSSEERHEPQQTKDMDRREIWIPRFHPKDSGFDVKVSRGACHLPFIASSAPSDSPSRV